MWLPALLAWSGLIYGAAPNPVITVLAGSIGAATVTAGGAWALARRQQSGTVTTSSADSLWSAYDKVMVRVEADNTTLRAEVRELREDNGKLRERVAVLERDNERIPDLEREVGRLGRMVNGA